jgi:hypothetical protein
LSALSAFSLPHIAELSNDSQNPKFQVQCNGMSALSVIVLGICKVTLIGCYCNVDVCYYYTINVNVGVINIYVTIGYLMAVLVHFKCEVIMLSSNILFTVSCNKGL